MEKLQYFFSTREIAFGLWIIVFSLCAFRSTKIRKEFFSLIKCAFSYQLLPPALILISYISILTALFSFSQLWDLKYLKYVICWVLFCGIPLCFGAVDNHIKPDYFKKMITDNLAILAIVEFAFGTFTFSLWKEVIIVPLTTICYQLNMIAQKDDKYKEARKITGVFLFILSVILLYLTLKEVLYTYRLLDEIDIFIKFAIPIVLSIACLPAAYLIGLISRYQMSFIKMELRDNSDKKSVQLSRRWKVFKTCLFSYTKIIKFQNDYVGGMHYNMSEEEFEVLLRELRM